MFKRAPVFAHCPKKAKNLVNAAGFVAGFVGAAGGRHHHAGEPAIDGGCPAVFHWTFDVAKQNEAGFISVVERPMDVCFVEHHGLAIAPAIVLRVDVDKTFVVIRRG